MQWWSDNMKHAGFAPPLKGQRGRRRFADWGTAVDGTAWFEISAPLKRWRFVLIGSSKSRRLGFR